MDPLEARALFPICDEHIHFNHAGVAPMSVRVRAAVEHVTQVMSEEGFDLEDYTETLGQLRSSLAGLVGVTPDRVSITRGTAHGISLLARGLDWKEGDNVVGARLEYPANLFPWMATRDRGVEMRLPRPPPAALRCGSSSRSPAGSHPRRCSRSSTGGRAWSRSASSSSGTATGSTWPRSAPSAGSAASSSPST